MESVYKYIHVDRQIDISMSKDKDIHIDMGLCGQILLVLLFDNIYFILKDGESLKVQQYILTLLNCCKLHN